MALPIRMIEGRNYSGHYNEVTLTGMSVNINKDLKGIMAPGFPDSELINIPQIGDIMIKSYVFLSQTNKEKNDDEDKSTLASLKRWIGEKSIVFTINGQIHAFLRNDFFRRQRVNLSYIKNNIMIVVDCTKISPRAREDLFMTSRDRLREGHLKNLLEDKLEEFLIEHEGLQELNEQIREERLRKGSEDDKSIIELIEKIMKTSPSLAQMLDKGNQIENPGFKWIKTKPPFKGKKFPTFFRLEDGKKEIQIECPINSYVTVKYETDVENEYFMRSKDKGKFNISNRDVFIKFSLRNGISRLRLRPLEDSKEGDLLELITTITDKINSNSHFISKIKMKTTAAKKNESKKINGPKKSPIIYNPENEPENGRKKYITKEIEGDKGLKMPSVKWLFKDRDREEWNNVGFNEYSGLKMELSKAGFDIYLNGDNYYLRQELSYRRNIKQEIIKNNYHIGLVLSCIGLYHHYKSRKDNEINQNNESEDIIPKIESFSDGLSQIILPLMFYNMNTKIEAILM